MDTTFFVKTKGVQLTFIKNDKEKWSPYYTIWPTIRILRERNFETIDLGLASQ